MSSKHKQRERAAMETNEVEQQPVAAESEIALQATQESLDKVRDILFGSQMREHDHRFTQLEDKLAAQLAAFREESRKQHDALSELVTNELSALSNRLTAEAQARSEAANHLAAELRNADRGLSDKLEAAVRSLTDERNASTHHLNSELQNKAAAVESRIAGSEQQQASATSELRTQLFDQTNKLRDENRQWQSEVQATLERLIAELRNAKTDRTALASLFTEMAGRLQG